MSVNSLFIIVWKVVGELQRPKNIIVGSKELWWQMKAAFHLLMQLAIDEDRQCRSQMRALEMKAEAGGTLRRSDDWACRSHQWQSRITREVPK